MWNYFQAAELLVAALLIGMYRALIAQRYAALAVLLTLGMLTREMTILFLGIAPLYLWERGLVKREAARLALAVAPALLALLWLDTVVSPETYRPGWGSSSSSLAAWSWECARL